MRNTKFPYILGGFLTFFAASLELSAQANPPVVKSQGLLQGIQNPRDHSTKRAEQALRVFLKNGGDFPTLNNTASDVEKSVQFYEQGDAHIALVREFKTVGDPDRRVPELAMIFFYRANGEEGCATVLEHEDGTLSVEERPFCMSNAPF